VIPGAAEPGNEVDLLPPAPAAESIALGFEANLRSVKLAHVVEYAGRSGSRA
jgi:hypothetical protein